MKLNFEHSEIGGETLNFYPQFTVTGETDQLTDVLLCAPQHLTAVPCCSVTKESLRSGFQSLPETALMQHDILRRTLEACGVRCRMLDVRSDLPDLCFTRDSMVTTPWGVVGLNPAMVHRSAEARYVSDALASIGGQPVARIDKGFIEGGDVAIIRPGLLIIGVSGERTNDAGANAFSEPFEAAGWEVLHYPFDPHFLHLDTVFCMLGKRQALACAEVLDDSFLEALAARDIEVLPVTYKEARKLGCNVLSLNGRTILAGSGTPRVSAMMRHAGFEVLELDIDQFTACGGGLHCVTMPLRRLPRDQNQ